MGDHWYSILGETRYGTNLREARKNGYLPSVTSVDKILANPGLDIWKQNIIIETCSKYPNDIELKAYTEWIKKEAFADSRRAMKLGNVIHKLAERYVSGKPLFFQGNSKDVWICFEPLRNWIDENLQPVKSTISHDYGAEVVLVNEVKAYAGKADYFGNGMLLDYKTTKITEKDIKKDGNIRKGKIYDSWGRQLSALKMASTPEPIEKVLSVIISSNADFPGVWVYQWNDEQLDKAWIEFDAALTIFKSQKDL